MKADGKIHAPMEGIRIWKNPKNCFCVFEAFFRADPNKRTKEFLSEIERSLPRRRFEMEYLIKWESFSGLPVFGDTWSDKVHLMKQNDVPHLGLPLLLGLDFGLTPAMVVAQLIGRRLFVFKEFVSVNMGLERFMSLVMKEMVMLFPPWRDYKKDFYLFIDPSGTARKDTDEGTCAKVLDKMGFKNIIPGAIAFEERRQSVEHFLTTMESGEACFQISEKNCPMLVKGFRGGYMFKEGQDEIEPSRLDPVKNEYSHPADALQMICTRILKITNHSLINIPKPSYVFTKQESRIG